MIIADLAIVLAAFFVSYYFRDTINTLYPLTTYLGILPVLLIIFGTCLYFFDIYSSFRLSRIPELIFLVFKATMLGFFIFGSFTYLFKILFISRSFIITVFLLSGILISLEKIIVIAMFRYMRKKGYNYRSILIVGTGRRAQNFISLVEEHNEWGLQIIGLVDEDPTKFKQIIKGYTVIGTFLDIPKILHTTVIDEVVFIVPRSWLGRIEEIIRFIELEGVKVSVAVDIFEMRFAKARQTDLTGFPLITFESTPDKIWQLFVKRIFDILVSGISLILISPLSLVLTLVIKKTSRGPAFFRQMRTGLNGRTFTLYKFRTMVDDAEQQLGSLMAQNEMQGPAFKMENDPRLTSLGKILRKLSLDELPQLWNVFKGEMSLVGPRPPIPYEVGHYDSWQRRRLRMRPGITCLWQISGRNKITDFNDWAKLDLKYIDNWSLWLDAKILLKTIPVVLLGIGAK